MEVQHKNTKIRVLAYIALASFISVFVFREATRSDCTQKKGNVCLTDECIRISSKYKRSIDNTVKPCDDFYQYTCGKWNEEYENKSTIPSIQESVNKELEKYLQSSNKPGDPLPVKQSKMLYRSCMNENYKTEPSKARLTKYLQHLGLPIIPKFFYNSSTTTHIFSWINSEKNIKRAMDTNVFIEVTIVNVTNVELNLRTRSLGYEIKKLREFLLQKKVRTARNVKINHYNKTYADEDTDSSGRPDNFGIGNETELNRLFTKFGFKRNKTLINIASEIMNEMETEIDFIINGLFNPNPKTYVISSLAKNVDKYTNCSDTWSEFLKTLKYFLGDAFKNDLEISIDLNQFNKFFSYIKSLPESHVEMYVWRTVLEEINDSYNFILSEIDEKRFRKSSKNCTTLVRTYMGNAVSLGLEIPPTEIISEVQKLTKNIKDAYEDSIRNNIWLGSRTRKMLLQRSFNMSTNIIKLRNKIELEEYYQNIQIDESDCAGNLMDINIMIFGSSDSKFAYENSKNPSSVNAHYISKENSINIPNVILREPLYNLGLQVLNYGALGSIVGHEICHGYDYAGILMHHGNAFEALITVNVLMCYISQYNSYYGRNDLMKPIVNTVNEDIADSTGIYLSFVAYQKYAKQEHQELLPGFEKFTNEQLFFIAYANVWCGVNKVEDQTVSAHSENRYRVISSLQNSEAFSKSFKCALGSKMNPNRKRCSIFK